MSVTDTECKVYETQVYGYSFILVLLQLVRGTLLVPVDRFIRTHLPLIYAII